MLQGGGKEMNVMAMPANLTRQTMDHLHHVTYPASKDDLVKACNEMSDVPENDKRWFMENLPEKNYQSAEDVKQAVGYLS